MEHKGDGKTGGKTENGKTEQERKIKYHMTRK